VYYACHTLNQLNAAEFCFTVAVKNFPLLYKTLRFISMFTHVCQHWTLSSYMRNPVYTLTMYVHKIQFSIILPTTSLSHIPLKFTTKILCAFISSPIHAKCPAHLILLNLITLVISGEEDQKVGNSFRPYATKVTQLTLLYQNYGHLLKSNVM